jgi:twitching motility protein PilT
VGIISQRLFPRFDQPSRIAATEIMINNPAIGNLIRNEKIHQIASVMQTSRAQGMHTLESSINELITRGLIDRKAAEPYLQEQFI